MGLKGLDTRVTFIKQSRDEHTEKVPHADQINPSSATYWVDQSSRTASFTTHLYKDNMGAALPEIVGEGFEY